MLCLKLVLGFFLFIIFSLSFLFVIPTGKTVQAHGCDLSYLSSTIALPPPAWVSSTMSGLEVTVTWAPVPGANCYEIGGLTGLGSRFSTSTSFSFTATCGTSYTPVVKGIDVSGVIFGGATSGGHPSGLSHPSSVLTFGPSVGAACAPPFTISASVGSCNVSGTQNVNLSWSNPPAGSLSFPIQRNTSAVYGGSTTVGCVDAPGSTFVDNPPVGTWYYWTVGLNATCGGAGSGSNSNIAGPVTTSACTPPLPGPFSITPNPPTASCIGGTPSVQISWTTSSGVTWYNVYRYRPGPIFDAVVAVSLPSTATTYTDPTGGNNGQPGPTSGTTYQYLVWACNAEGCTSSNGGVLSSSVTAPSCSPPTVNLTANGSEGPLTISHNSAATLAWTTTNGPTSCTASASPISSTWTGSKAVGGGSESTGTLTGSGSLPTPYTFSIFCSNSLGTSPTDSVTVNVNPPFLPWIQTTGGDVHSNVEINTPGGP